jgi:hypothetical protein
LQGEPFVCPLLMLQCNDAEGAITARCQRHRCHACPSTPSMPWLHVG